MSKSAIISICIYLFLISFISCGRWNISKKWNRWKVCQIGRMPTGLVCSGSQCLLPGKHLFGWRYGSIWTTSVKDESSIMKPQLKTRILRQASKIFSCRIWVIWLPLTLIFLLLPIWIHTPRWRWYLYSYRYGFIHPLTRMPLLLLIWIHLSRMEIFLIFRKSSSMISPLTVRTSS